MRITASAPCALVASTATSFPVGAERAATRALLAGASARDNSQQRRGHRNLGPRRPQVPPVYPFGTLPCASCLVQCTTAPCRPRTAQRRAAAAPRQAAVRRVGGFIRRALARRALVHRRIHFNARRRRRSARTTERRGAAAPRQAAVLRVGGSIRRASARRALENRRSNLNARRRRGSRSTRKTEHRTFRNADRARAHGWMSLPAAARGHAAGPGP